MITNEIFWCQQNFSVKIKIECRRHIWMNDLFGWWNTTKKASTPLNEWSVRLTRYHHKRISFTFLWTTFRLQSNLRMAAMTVLYNYLALSMSVLHLKFYAIWKIEVRHLRESIQNINLVMFTFCDFVQHIMEKFTNKIHKVQCTHLVKSPYT